MNSFVWGACAMASFVIAIFFLKYHRDTSDRLFIWFALAFGAFAVHWTGLGIASPQEDTRHYFYLVRLLAFVLILTGVIDKNRRAAR
jgi:hypothetical protein